MSKEIEEIYKDYDVNSIKWMEKNNCTTTKEITLKLMELAVQSKLSELEKKNNELLKSHSDWMSVALERKDDISQFGCGEMSFETKDIEQLIHWIDELRGELRNLTIQRVSWQSEL